MASATLKYVWYVSMCACTCANSHVRRSGNNALSTPGSCKGDVSSQSRPNGRPNVETPRFRHTSTQG